MVRRLLDCFASDILEMEAADLKQAIRMNEGRTILCEVKESEMPLLLDITNAELARAAGADLVLLNKLDVQAPHIIGLGKSDSPIKQLKRYIARPLGVNLEPTDSDLVGMGAGRKCSLANVRQCQALGFDFICLTGNPYSMVSNQAILDAIQLVKSQFKGLVFAGKMHLAGVEEDITSQALCEQMIEAGADVILIPAVGTIPGFSEQDFERCRKTIHQQGALCMATNGASQDCARPETVRQIALKTKVLGADIHHLGSSGPGGMTPPENIMEVSMAIRGTNHTFRRMAASNLR